MSAPGLPAPQQSNERYRPQPGIPPETVALLQQVLGGVAGLPIALQFLPFQFPSLQHLDERVAQAIRRAGEVSGLSFKTTAAYRSAYRYFRAYLRTTGGERAFLSGQLLDQRRMLEGWIASLRAQGVSHTTVNTYWRGLHGAFVRIAREDNLVTPTQYVETPPPGKSLPRFLTRPALEDVFRFVRNFQWPGGPFERARNIAVIAVMALGGCRRGEVLAMQVEDVDCTEGTIRIKRGKGPRGGKPRIICMPPALAASMTTYMEVRADRKLATDRVFVSVGADSAIAEVTIRRLCRLITAKTGIRVAPHLLRHTCATLMRQAGITDRLSMDQLGHSSLGVLQRYSHVAPGERQQAMARFEFDLDGEAMDGEGRGSRAREEHRLDQDQT